MASTPAQSLTLISTGLADPRLQPARGNPDATQFVKVVRKTTRWAAQWNRVEFDGSAEFGQRVSMTLPRIGHLISGVTIAVTMPDIYTTQLRAIQAAGGTSLTDKGTFLGPMFGWTNSLGHAMIQQIELEIGGTIVETLDSRLLEIMDELYEPLEGVLTKNRMIKRAPSGFNEKTWLSPDLTKVYIPIPFWFSRRGVYSHALPIQALTSDIVRIHVTLRPIEELVYTSARPDSRNPAIPIAATIVDGKYELRTSRFYRSDIIGSSLLYSFNADMPTAGVLGSVIDGVQMPARFSPVDAYALVEYIFLEEFEALAFRTGELTYHVEQHVAVPVVQTQGMKEIRVNLPYANPVKELFWVLQRPEVAQYNAWFLFTRDLAGVVSKIPPSDGVVNPCLTPWWPDAALVPAADRAWCISPGFQTSRSEPLESVTLMYNSYERAVHDGGSFYRGVVPAMFYTKSAAINRYVYAYSFGARAEGYAPAGVANWDKIPRKEMYLRLANERGCAAPPNMNLYVYVTIWNVFKVFGGRGGMLFTN